MSGARVRWSHSPALLRAPPNLLQFDSSTAIAFRSLSCVVAGGHMPQPDLLEVGLTPRERAANVAADARGMFWPNLATAPTGDKQIAARSPPTVTGATISIGCEPLPC